MPRDPEVLKKLADRCGLDLYRDHLAWSKEVPKFSAWVHQIPREEVARAVAEGIFSVDHRASLALKGGPPVAADAPLRPPAGHNEE